jgi:hypothetical protein
MRLFECILSWFFPQKNLFIETPEDMELWSRFEVSNHPDLDPFRPFGHWDSWAGHVKRRW